jgi:hypothetical protein
VRRAALPAWELERLADNMEERKAASDCTDLDWCEEQLATDALKLLANPHRSGVKVDVFPAQAESFVTSQAVEDGRVRALA